MKKIIKRVGLLIIVGAVLYGVSYAWRAFPIISGYGAKNMCSCVFVSERSVESVLDKELATFPLSLGEYTVDTEKGEVYGEVFGMALKTAVFRKDLGCTLLSESTAKQVISKDNLLSPLEKLPDSLRWPSMIEDSIQIDYNMEGLRKALSKAFAEDHPEKMKNTRGVVVVHNGKVIIEQYGEGFDENTPQLGWSMTKSITNAMVGMLVKEGKVDIKSPAPIASWQQEGDPRNKITVDQLLRMSSGLFWEENYGGPSAATNMLFKSADMADVAISQELAYTPDTKWYYSSGTSNILSKIVRNALGDTDYHNYIRNGLFNKLGTSSVIIEPDPSGTYVGSSYMYATPKDWAKFGLLYLNDGVWNGERILPEGWVKYSSTPTPAAPRGQYGAQFWLNAGDADNPENRWYPDAPTDLYSMNGFDGQRVFIIPSRNAVIVRMGLSKRGVFDFNEFLKDILNALPEGSN